MLCVTGWNSVIVRELVALHPEETFARAEPAPNGGYGMLPMAQRFVYAAGVLHGKSAREIERAEAIETLEVNLYSAIKFVEAALATNPAARVCVVGSMSGITGSYDDFYAASKAGLHLYVQTRAVRPPAQLFAVAPGIVSDSRMTRARKDYPKVLYERPTVTAAQVAQIISLYLWDKPPEEYGNGVIKIPGEVLKIC